MKKIYLTFAIPFLLILLADIIFFTIFSNKTAGLIKDEAFFDHKAVTGQSYDYETNRSVDDYTYYYSLPYNDEKSEIDLIYEYLGYYNELDYIGLSQDYGKTIQVYYDPQNPSKYVVANREFSNYLIGSYMIPIILSLFLLGYGANKKSDNPLGMVFFAQIPISSLNCLLVKTFLYFSFDLNLIYNHWISITFNVLHIIAIILFLPIYIKTAKSYDATEEELQKIDKENKDKLANTLINKPYVFDTFTSFIFSCIFVVLSAFIYYGLTLKKDLITEYLFISLIIAIPSTFSALFMIGDFINNIIETTSFKKAIKNNTPTCGKIVGHSIDVIKNHEGPDVIKQYLSVSYYDADKGKEITFSTPQLNFNLLGALGSDDCNVYKYNNKVFAYDFVPSDENIVPLEFETNQVPLQTKKPKLLPYVLLAITIWAVISFFILFKM